MSETRIEAVEATEAGSEPQADRRLYLTLVDRFHSRVYGHLCLLCGDETLAADLTAETFLRIWKNPPRSRTARSLRAYVFSIAVNEWRQHLRRRGLPVVSMDAADGTELVADDDPLATLSLRELTAAVRLAVEGLPPMHRAVVLLHNLEGMSLREVADALEIPVGTAKSRLSAAFVMLRRSLREWRGDSDEVR